MKIETLIVALIIVGAFFLIARKGCGCGAKNVDKSKDGTDKKEGGGCCGHSH